MLSRTILKTPTNFIKNSRAYSSFNPHSYLQSPGASNNNRVTLLPGYHIGPEITGKLILLLILKP